MAMEHRGLEKIGGYILIEFKLTLVGLFDKTSRAFSNYNQNRRHLHFALMMRLVKSQVRAMGG